MGLYAELTDAQISCPNCNSPIKGDWQFFFGSVTNLPHYKIGEKIAWGNQSLGEEGLPEVYAVAYPSSNQCCVKCRDPNILALVAIHDDVIIGIEFYKNEAWVPETILVGPNREIEGPIGNNGIGDR